MYQNTLRFRSKESKKSRLGQPRFQLRLCQRSLKHGLEGVGLEGVFGVRVHQRRGAPLDEEGTSLLSVERATTRVHRAVPPV